MSAADASANWLSAPSRSSCGLLRSSSSPTTVRGRMISSCCTLSMSASPRARLATARIMRLSTPSSRRELGNGALDLLGEAAAQFLLELENRIAHRHLERLLAGALEALRLLRGLVGATLCLRLGLCQEFARPRLGIRDEFLRFDAALIGALLLQALYQRIDARGDGLRDGCAPWFSLPPRAGCCPRAPARRRK